MKRRISFVLACVGAGALCCFARTRCAAQQQATFSSDVNVVNVLATVRNKKGEVVHDLTKDDFILEEDGRPQAIRYFTHDTDLPLTLGLLIDTSGSMRGNLHEERTASHAFFGQVLRENTDSAFLIHFDHEVELLQDLTSSRAKLEEALDKMDSPELHRSDDPQDDPSRGGRDRGDQRGPGSRRFGMGTTLYDAVFLASDEVLSAQKGRKAVILISDGEDRGSKEPLQQAIESAQRADTIIYAIYMKGEQHGFGFGGPGDRRGGMGGRHGGWPGGGVGDREEHADGRNVMELLARKTGGRMFEYSKKQPIEKIYAAIQEDLRSQYNLGFSPDKDGLEPGYHKLHLATKQKELTVQAREGYYAGRQRSAADLR